MSDKTLIIDKLAPDEASHTRDLLSLIIPHVHFYKSADLVNTGCFAIYTNQDIKDEKIIIDDLVHSIVAALALSNSKKKNHHRSPDVVRIADALSAFSAWLNVYYKVKGHSSRPTDGDVHHSSLLHRLLCGKKQLPVPPPTFYSYPCYPLGEGEKIISPEVIEDSKNPNKISIGQNSLWTKVDNKTVKYDLTGEIYRFSKPFEDNQPWRYIPPTIVQGEIVPEDRFLYIQKVKCTPVKVKRNDEEFKVIDTHMDGHFYKVESNGRTEIVSADEFVISEFKE